MPSGKLHGGTYDPPGRSLPADLAQKAASGGNPVRKSGSPTAAAAAKAIASHEKELEGRETPVYENTPCKRGSVSLFCPTLPAKLLSCM